MGNILMTGVTGFLGEHTVKKFLKATDDHIYGIVREKKGVPSDQRPELRDLMAERFHVLNGDFTKPQVLNDHSVPDFDEMWHIGGSTDFQEARRPETTAINVDGVMNILGLIKRLKIPKFHHIRTANAAGKEKGTVYEDGLKSNPEFRNVYEETKYLAEQIIRSSGVNHIILRPSIIMGNSKSFEADSDKMVYGVVKLYHTLNRLLEREYRDENGLPNNLNFDVRGVRSATKNCITVDSVVEMMLAVKNNGQIGQTFHLTNPIPTTIGELHDNILAALDINYLSISPNVHDNGHKKQKFVNRGVELYEEYMNQDDPVFDMTNVVELIGNNSVPKFDSDLQQKLYKAYAKRLEKTKNKKGLELNLEKRLESFKKFGKSTLSFSSLFNQFEAYRIEGVDGYLPFVRADRTCVMVGDPVASDESSFKLIKSFVKQVTQEGYNPAAVQVGHHSAVVFASQGFSVNTLGTETNVDLTNYDPELKGKEYSSLRRWLRYAKDQGVVVEECDLTDLDKEQVLSVSDNWMERKKNKSELGVLLRELSLEPEPYVRRFVAKKGDSILGYIFFDPIFKDNSVVGYYTNIERYLTEHESIDEPKKLNLMQVLVAEAAEVFQGEGAQKIALGLSPLNETHLNFFKYHEHKGVQEIFQNFYDESKLYAFKGIADHKKRYKNTVTTQSYFCSKPGLTIEDIMNIFEEIGILKMNGD